MLRIVSIASTARSSGQPTRASSPRAAEESRKTRRRARRPWPSSKRRTPAARRTQAEAGVLEVLAHGPEGVAVIGLQHQQIVGALGPDPLGYALLAAHRVQGDDAALEPQGVEQ